MPATQLDDVFDAEVATRTASAEFPEKLALGFPGAPMVRNLDPLIRGTKIGSRVKFPRWKPLGAMSAFEQGGTISTEKLEEEIDTAVVQAGAKGVEIEDWADLNSEGDGSAEAGRQFSELSARYVDSELVTEAGTAELSSTAGGTPTWSNFIDAIIDNWGDNALEQVGGIVVHSKVMGSLMKLTEFIRKEELGPEMGLNVRGFIGVLGTYPVFVSDRVNVNSGSPDTYDNLICKQGALGLKFQRMLLVETDRDVLAKSDILAADVRFAVHLLYGDPQPVIVWNTQ